jgi:hypothetical protein
LRPPHLADLARGRSLVQERKSRRGRCPQRACPYSRLTKSKPPQGYQPFRKVFHKGPASCTAAVVFCGKAVRRDVLPLGPLTSGLCRSQLLPAQGAEPWVVVVPHSGLCRSHLLPAQGAEPWVAVVPHPVRAVTEGSRASCTAAVVSQPVEIQRLFLGPALLRPFGPLETVGVLLASPRRPCCTRPFMVRNEAPPDQRLCR